MPLLRCTTPEKEYFSLPKQDGCEHARVSVSLAGWVDVHATEKEKDSGDFVTDVGNIAGTGLSILISCEDCDKQGVIEFSSQEITQLIHSSLSTAIEEGWSDITEQETPITPIGPFGLRSVCDSMLGK